jgi:hypothetical protein
MINGIITPVHGVRSFGFFHLFERFLGNVVAAIPGM